MAKKLMKDKFFVNRQVFLNGISAPGLIFFKGLFQGLIFGGAYIRRG